MPNNHSKKPIAAPATPFPKNPDELHCEGKWLWIPLRNEWRDVSDKPEEIVRQRFIRHLCDNYGYSLVQMDQERRTMHGHKSPRADIVIWEKPEAKAEKGAPVLVIECKGENIDINIKDYYQGESYTRAVGCEFFIANNARYTAIFKLLPGLPGEFVQINEIPKAADWGDAKRIEEIKSKLRAKSFKTSYSSVTVSCAMYTRWSLVARLIQFRKFYLSKCTSSAQGCMALSLSISSTVVKNI
jgi:type I restriction enzyme M protein